MKKHNIVYMTINMINSKFYIGKHSTDVIDDGYLGSGLLIKSAISLYGKENFKRIVLHDLKTSEESSHIEKELVNEDLVSNTDCYNIALGGSGGNLGEEVNKRIGKKMSELLKGVPKTLQHREALRKVWLTKEYKLSTTLKNKIQQSITHTWSTMSPEERKIKCGHQGSDNGFFGKSHSEKSIKLMKANLPNRTGGMNPNARKITFNGVTYDTLNDCREKLQISKRKLYKLLGETQ